MKTPSHRRQTIHSIGAIAASAALLLAGCASAVNSPVTLPTVGPSAQAPMGPMGGLIVNSATEEFNDGNLVRYPHSNYDIYRADGAHYRYVRNRISLDDEKAQLVKLPPGKYFVLANSETQGRVRIPVVIAANRTTVVNLESNHTGAPPKG